MYSDMLHKAAPLSGNMAGVTVHVRATTSCLLLFFVHPRFPPHARPVSLHPEGASAAQWALKLKTEQIKVTVGGGLGVSQ